MPLRGVVMSAKGSFEAGKIIFRIITRTIMTEEPNDPGKKLDEHLETFEKLPEKQKELHHLEEAEKKSSGKDLEKVDQAIEKKTS